MPHPTRHLVRCMGAAACLVAATNGCLATHDSFARVSVVIDASESGPFATVRVPITDIRKALPDFDAEKTTYFSRGRAPLTHRYEDADSDGTPDFVVVKIPTAGTEHWLIAVTRK